jgi:hypothetical protein
MPPGDWPPGVSAISAVITTQIALISDSPPTSPSSQRSGRGMKPLHRQRHEPPDPALPAVARVNVRAEPEPQTAVSTSTSTRRPGHAGTGRQQERHHGDQPGGDRQVDHCAAGYASLARAASGKTAETGHPRQPERGCRPVAESGRSRRRDRVRSPHGAGAVLQCLASGPRFIRAQSARGCSAAGSAPPWHGGGQGFESPQLHKVLADQKQYPNPR